MFQAAIEICLSRLSGLKMEPDPGSTQDTSNYQFTQNNGRNVKNETPNHNNNSVGFENNNYTNFLMSGSNSNHDIQNKLSYDNHRVKCEYNAIKNNTYTGSNRTSVGDSRTNFSDLSTKSQINFQQNRGDLITEKEINRLIQDRCDIHV